MKATASFRDVTCNAAEFDAYVANEILVAPVRRAVRVLDDARLNGLGLSRYATRREREQDARLEHAGFVLARLVEALEKPQAQPLTPAVEAALRQALRYVEANPVRPLPF